MDCKPSGKTLQTCRISHWVLMMSPERYIRLIEGEDTRGRPRDRNAEDEDPPEVLAPTDGLRAGAQHADGAHDVVVLVLAELANNERLVLVQLPQLDSTCQGEDAGGGNKSESHQDSNSLPGPK